MPSFIDRRAAYNAIVHNYSVDEQLFALDRTKNADVRPVVRGHWITEEEAEKIGDYSKRDTCSVCGHCDWDCTESAYFNFCPNCGALMKEDKNA